MAIAQEDILIWLGPTPEVILPLVAVLLEANAELDQQWFEGVVVWFGFQEELYTLHGQAGGQVEERLSNDRPQDLALWIELIACRNQWKAKGLHALPSGFFRMLYDDHLPNSSEYVADHMFWPFVPSVLEADKPTDVMPLKRPADPTVPRFTPVVLFGPSLRVDVDTEAAKSADDRTIRWCIVFGERRDHQQIGIVQSDGSCYIPQPDLETLRLPIWSENRRFVDEDGW